MSVTTRRTIASPTSVSGIGLHLGEPCTLTFRPASAGSGVRFRRIDLEGTPEIPATIEHAELTERRTQLGRGAQAIHTVEHVLAAVGGLGIDDLAIDIDGPEPPILDGSARPFVDALERAGLAEHGGRVEVLEVREPVRVSVEDASYIAMPSPCLELDVTIDFPHPLIGKQRGEYRVSRDAFARELAGARTFGFIREVEMLRAMGLIKGASTQNAVVMDEESLVDCELRWPDEFVRHKAMDCVGDLVLAGRRVRGRIVATKPSHRGTVTLVRELVKRFGGGAAAGNGTRQERRMSEPQGTRGAMGIEEIMKILPHRYPFLLVDRILEIEERKRVVGIKNVTINEPFFQGHFPGHPVMPGVLVIEALAQVGGVLLLGLIDDPGTKVVYFTSLDNVKWRKPVRPGDQLRFELDVVQIRGRLCKMKGVALVDGEVAAEAEMSAMVVDR